MDKDELKEIEEIADAELFDFDENLDLTDNLILFSRKLFFRIVAVISSFAFILLSSLQCQYGVIKGAVDNINNPEYVESYYLINLGENSGVLFEIPQNPTISNPGKIILGTLDLKGDYSYLNKNIFERDITPGRTIYPPKSFDDFDKNIKVIRKNGTRLKVHYLGRYEMIVRIREKKLHKGRGLGESESTISDIYLGTDVRYGKLR